MRLAPKRYEVNIRLYMDEEKKVLYKFIHWHVWAWGMRMASYFADLEGKIQVRKYSSVKTYTVEINKL